MTPESDPQFEKLLDYVRDNRGFDFTGYKRASLMRRVRKRMQEVGIEDFTEYHDYLQVHPEEFTHLFNTILINVTSFFRDPDSWDYLGTEIVPRFLSATAEDQIRVWSVGSASGEEAYTVAMVLAQVLGTAQIRERVKIYATDVDEEALAQARAGVYSAKAVEAIPEDLRAKYLTRVGEEFAFGKDIRRAVIFGRHDLLTDAPISRVDLIVCRNTIMYFNADAQSKIYSGFHFALRPHGYLFLGKSEMLLTRTNIFTPVDLKRRVFARVSTSAEQRAHPRVADELETDGKLRRAVFESATTAQVVVDPSGRLAAANGRARKQFNLGGPDIGREFHDLELSYRPAELRSRIDRAISDRSANLEEAVAWTSLDGDPRFLDIEVVPLVEDGEVLGVSITFDDVTRPRELQSELERSRRELETAYEEIQSTVEELETTNEELQSTNEELETTNEELQSTNEELETMNEELQSTNEELETINSELHERTGDLNQANVFLASILEGLQAGVVVLDSELAVESWNSLSEDMWGLRADEVRGKNLFALDIGLPVHELRDMIRECSSGTKDYAETTVDAVNRRGQPIRCKVLCSPMRDQEENHHGIILLLETV